MDCTEAQRRILDSGTADEALRQHLERCLACAELAADDGALARWLTGEPRGLPAEPSAELSAEPPAEPPAEPSAELLAALQQDLAREARPVARLRSLSTPVRVILSLAAAGVVVLTGLLSLRPDLGVYPWPRLVLELGLLTLVAAGAGWLWLRPLHRPLRRPAFSDGLVLALVLLAVLLPWGLSSLPAAHLDHPSSLAGTGDDLLRRAVACFIHGSLLGLPLALFVALLGRAGRRLVRLALLPAAVGALSGLIGLHLHCPLTAPVHQLAGHAPIALVLVLLAWAIYRQVRR